MCKLLCEKTRGHNLLISSRGGISHKDKEDDWTRTLEATQRGLFWRGLGNCLQELFVCVLVHIENLSGMEVSSDEYYTTYRTPNTC